MHLNGAGLLWLLLLKKLFLIIFGLPSQRKGLSLERRVRQSLQLKNAVGPASLASGLPVCVGVHQPNPPGAEMGPGLFSPLPGLPRDGSPEPEPQAVSPSPLMTPGINGKFFCARSKWRPLTWPHSVPSSSHPMRPPAFPDSTRILHPVWYLLVHPRSLLSLCLSA